MIGIYFLKSNDVVVYVGKSIQIESRIKQHTKEGIKKFDNYCFVECNQEILSETEEFYILFHNPKYNIARAEKRTTNHKKKVIKRKQKFKAIKAIKKPIVLKSETSPALERLKRLMEQVDKDREIFMAIIKTEEGFKLYEKILADTEKWRTK